MVYIYFIITPPGT